MKIISVDNFDRESVAQVLVAERITSEWAAKVMLKALQDTVHEGSPTWYTLVEDDHRLWRGMAEFCGPDPEEVKKFIDEEIGG